jgi:8-oxo-dGTP pyrophosphatase MutT (NUDIX family)
MGAGILPICIINNKLLFLFGKDYNTKSWSDFGGRAEKGETDFDTAIREGAEELNGFLGSNTKLANLVKTNNLLTINYDNYKIYIFIIKFDKNLPYYFNSSSNFILDKFSNKTIPEGLFEKSEIRWFTYNDLKNQRNNFRLFYRPIIDIITNEYETLLVKTKQLKCM